VKPDHIVAATLAGASIALLAATLLAQSGCYSKWIGYGVSSAFICVFLAVAHGLICALGKWISDEPSAGKRAGRIIGGLAAFAVCPLLAGVLFFHPSENLSGNQDQGMYLAAAFNIQRTGSTKIALPVIDGLPELDRHSWLPHMPVQFGRLKHAPAHYWCLATGFVLEDQQALRGPAVPHFPQGFPVAMAALLDVGGLTALNAGNALLILCAACWLALLVSEWLGAGYSLLVVPFFVFSPLVLWCANRFYAEPLVLFFWVGLVWSLHRSEEQPILSGFAAAFATAAACITKIDALAMVGLLGLVILWSRRQPIWQRTALAACVAGALAVATVLWQQNSPYLADTLASLLGDRSLLFFSAFLFVLAATPIFYRQKFTLFSKHPLLLPVVGVVLVLGTIVYLYLIRTLLGPTDRYHYIPLGKDILSYREMTLQRFGWYFPYGGLWPLMLGLALSITKLKTLSGRVFLAGGVASLLFLSYDVRCNPLQPYCMRRFLPYAVPLLISGAVFLAHFLKEKTRYWPALLLPILVVYAVGFVRLDRELNGSNEHDGLRKNLAELASAIPNDAIVVISSKSPLALLALPLRCIWAKETFIVNFDRRDPAQLRLLHASILKQLSGDQRLLVLDTVETFSFNSGIKTQLLLAKNWSTETQPGSYTEIGTASKSVPWQCCLSEFVRPNGGGQPLRLPNQIK